MADRSRNKFGMTNGVRGDTENVSFWVHITTTGSTNASLLRSLDLLRKSAHYATLRAFRIPNAFLPKTFSANTNNFTA